MRNKELDPQTVSGVEGRSGISRLRLLDFDDLFLMSHLLEGATIAATAKQLGLTQPAITQRVRKIERVFGEPMLQKAGRHVRLTKAGRAICVKATDALALMREVSSTAPSDSLTVGVEPLLHAGWLWPAIEAVKTSHPDARINAQISAADEVSAMLEAGTMIAAITSHLPSGKLESVSLGDEDFIVVASPAVAAVVNKIQDLESEVLLEIDHSYNLLARVESTTRAKLKFKDVWFVGGAAQVLAAAQAGHGVAILPERLVRGALAAGRLKAILPDLDIPPNEIRLVYRKDRASEALIERLAEALKRPAAR